MDFADPALSAVRRDWTFSPGPPPWRLRLARLQIGMTRSPAPAHRVLAAPAGAGPWTIYFAFLPDGRPSATHSATLAALRDLGRPILLVCATEAPDRIPAELADRCDALIWKALGGFDFSAYTVGLRTLAAHCPGSDALVMNDSVFGPLGDLDPWLRRCRWDLTGFTATANGENHIQSYAFHLKAVTPDRMDRLASVFMPAHAYDRFRSVVAMQELRLARVAARTMSVGALCYVQDPRIEDPTLQLALPLVEAGFPFLKRSLLGKLQHLYPREQVVAALAHAGYGPA